MSAEFRIEIDGQPATAEQLRDAAFAGYGHFTAMQVRRRRVRGLDLHLARLDQGNTEMFGTGLDGDLVRDRIRHALGDAVSDASVRVYVVATRTGAICLAVTIRPPADDPASLWRLRSVPYLRSVPHLKHASDFGQSYYGDLARRDGYDEALLTGPDGEIAEGSVTNICFWDGSAITWPDAPHLRGITMGLIEPRLPGHGIPVRHATVRLAGLGAFSAAFVTNSRGIAAVSQIDDHRFQSDLKPLTTLTDIYESVPWDPI